jgi:hypothetical protein
MLSASDTNLNLFNFFYIKKQGYILMVFVLQLLQTVVSVNAMKPYWTVKVLYMSMRS